MSSASCRMRWTSTLQGEPHISTNWSFDLQPEVAWSLRDAGFEIEEIGDAPDRRGLELVFIANR
jgi:hypothetical protein